MEETSFVVMEKTRKIIRRSIYTFLQNYHYFTTTSILLALPFSATVLLSQTLFAASSPVLLITHDHFTSLFQALGLIKSSNFISLLNLNLCQTILTSISILPFTLSFLLISKASIIHALKLHKPSFPPSFFSSLYKPLLLTNLCNILLIVTINTAALFFRFVFSKTHQAFGFAYQHSLLSLAWRAFFYYFHANIVVNCNLALVVAGMENCTGFRAIHKACLLRRGRNSMALLLALPTSMALIAIEALFNYRVSRLYHILGRLNISIVMEGMFIAYLYSLFIVLGTISNCIFFKSFASNLQMNHAYDGYLVIDIVEDEDEDKDKDEDEDEDDSYCKPEECTTSMNCFYRHLQESKTV